MRNCSAKNENPRYISARRKCENRTTCDNLTVIACKAKQCGRYSYNVNRRTILVIHIT